MNPSKRLGFALAALCTLASCFTASACSKFKVATGSSEEAPDGSSQVKPEASPATNSDAGERATADADAPRQDFACARDTWIKSAKTQPECAPRQVRRVDDEAATDATGVSIARTSTGRIGIVFNRELSDAEGELRLVHFVPNEPAFKTKLEVRAAGFASHTGYKTRIAASEPDVLHVLSFDMDDVSQSGDLVMVRLAGGLSPLSEPELIRGGIASPTEISLAVSPSGSTVVMARVAKSGGADAGASLKAYVHSDTGAFSALADITQSLSPLNGPGVGASSLAWDGNGQLHLLYHHCEFSNHSTPRYHTLGGSTWSYRKTIDNAIPLGFSGFNPRIVTYQSTKIAAFFFRKFQQGGGVPGTAELRLATWKLDSDEPVIEVVDQAIPSTEPSDPRYRVAMAADRHGLIHLAIVRPSPNDEHGYLEYRRQTRDVSGGTKWLSDLVDDDVIASESGASVDLVVDSASRPHIAYISGVDHQVRYATRYDR